MHYEAGALRYRIIVEGELSNGSQRGFERFHIEPEADETVIEGEFADTVELSLTLDRLQGLGFGLIAVSLVDGNLGIGSRTRIWHSVHDEHVTVSVVQHARAHGPE